MPLRVVQWATGAVGTQALRQVIDHPELELVGVWVSSAAKDGVDAGSLCGRPATGVPATTSKTAILALNADVVLHCPAAIGDFDTDVIDLLASGKNVISTVAYFSPRTDGHDVVARAEKACADGGTTLFGTGLDPGFVCDRVAAVLTGCVTDIERIRMSEATDISAYANPGLLTDLGVGKPLEELDMENDQIQHMVLRLFPSAVARLADHLGLDIDEVRLTGFPELAFATTDLDLAIGRIPEGTLSGGCYEYGAYHDEDLVVSHRWAFYAERDAIPEHWPKAPLPTPDAGLPYVATVDITGRPNLSTTMSFSDPEDTIFLPTATCAVRAIPAVIDAPPGLLREELFGCWRGGR
jgi:hypothetical protein